MNAPPSPAHPIPTKSLVQYGFIALPLAFAGFPLYVLAPDFYATQHGLSLTLLGTVLLGVRLFDAIQDPVIGWLTDRMEGGVVPFVVGAALVLCFAIFGLFNLMFSWPVLWFALCMFFAVGAYSVLTIVLGVRATLWTTDQNDQTRIASTREFFGLIGLIVAVSIPGIFSQLMKSKDVYGWYTGILSLLMLMGVIFFFKLPKIKKIKKEYRVSLLSGLRGLPQETYHLFIVYVFGMLASSLPAVLITFYVRDLLGAQRLMGLFLLLYFLSGAMAMPFWKYLSTRIGKYKTWFAANFCAITGFFGAFFLEAGDVWAYGIVCIFSGFALGADLTLPPSILADHIHKCGKSAYSGTYYALLAFFAKVSFALASVIALPILDVSGFRPQTTNALYALQILSTVYALIPCFLKLISAGLLYLFFIRYLGGKREIFQSHGNHRGF